MVLLPAVAQGLAELEHAFADHVIEHHEDGQGGAWVIVQDVCLGQAFVPSISWIGFAISALYPRADIYPHFVCPELARVDGTPITTPLNARHTMPGADLSAVMVSRRSTRWDPSRDTAALKLHRVLLWFAEQHVTQ